MNLGTLKPAEGSVRDTKRIGRGNGSGYGRTAGKDIMDTNLVQVPKIDFTLRVVKLHL